VKKYFKVSLVMEYRRSITASYLSLIYNQNSPEQVQMNYR